MWILLQKDPFLPDCGLHVCYRDKCGEAGSAAEEASMCACAVLWLFVADVLWLFVTLDSEESLFNKLLCSSAHVVFVSPYIRPL